MQASCQKIIKSDRSDNTTLLRQKNLSESKRSRVITSLFASKLYLPDTTAVQHDCDRTDASKTRKKRGLSTSFFLEQMAPIPPVLPHGREEFHYISCNHRAKQQKKATGQITQHSFDKKPFPNGSTAETQRLSLPQDCICLIQMSVQHNCDRIDASKMKKKKEVFRPPFFLNRWPPFHLLFPTGVRSFIIYQAITVPKDTKTATKCLYYYNKNTYIM